MSASASLLLFGDEQISFPGIPRCAPQSRAESGAEPPPAGAGVSPCPGQLCLGPSQLLLADADPEPQQPSLLPEPALWELVDRPAARDAHRPELRARLRQLPLFPRRG